MHFQKNTVSQKKKRWEVWRLKRLCFTSDWKSFDNGLHGIWRQHWPCVPIAETPCLYDLPGKPNATEWSHSEIKEVKLKHCETIIYFISFNDTIYRNQPKIQCLRKNMLKTTVIQNNRRQPSQSIGSRKYDIYGIHIWQVYSYYKRRIRLFWKVANYHHIKSTKLLP